MNGIGLGKKIFFALIFAIFIVSPAAAEWDITVPNHVTTDGSSIYTSPEKQSIVFVEVRTAVTDEPVTDNGTTDSSRFIYRYNDSEGEYQNLTYYQKGYWYAKFDSDLSKHGLNDDKAKIRFDVKGDRDPNTVENSDGWQNTSLNLKAGEHKVDIVKGLPSKVDPGHEANVTVNVTNRTNGDTINQTEVMTYFRNSSWYSTNYRLRYNQSTQLFEGSVTVPSNYDSEYLMRTHSKNRSDQAPPNSQGAYSRFIETLPDLKGEVQNLTNIQGCETDLAAPSPAAYCETEGSLNAVYNVTGVEADNVKVKAFKRNRSSNELEQYSEKTMQEDQAGLYSSKVSIPDINTSAYDREVTVKFNVTRGDRNHVDIKTIDYSSLKAIHTGTRSAVQGESYELSIQTVKPESLTPWSDSRIQTLETKVTDSNGNTFRNYNLSNLTFDQQAMAFEKDIMIPEKAENGRWDLQIQSSDIYGDVSTISSGFSVSTSEQTFEINDTVFDKEQEGVEDFNLSVRKMVGDDITLNTNASEGLSDDINISESVDITDPVENISVTVNLTSFESVDGYINFTDASTGYNIPVELTVSVRSCQFSAEDICSMDGRWVNVSADSRGDYTKEVVIKNTADDGNATNVSTNITGNISNLVTIDDLYSVEDELTIQINYSVQEKGNYTGSIEFEPNSSTALIYNTSLETFFSSTTASEFSTDPAQIDLGSFPSGTDKGKEVQVHNNGGAEVQNITVESSVYTVSTNQTEFNLSAGDSTIVNLTIEDIAVEDGNVTFNGVTPAGEVETDIEVEGTPVQDYSVLADQLSTAIEEIKPVRDSNLSDTLTELTDTISYIKGNWSEGNYLEAKGLYETASNRLQYVQENQGDDTSTDGDDGSDDPGNQSSDKGGSDNPDTGGGDQTDTGNAQENNDEGGLPLIPIVAILVVLVIIGFVVYESYIPEEGDPLYGVLGDK